MSDRNSWGNRSQYEVDCMIDSANADRLYANNKGTGCSSEFFPNPDDSDCAYAQQYLKERGLQSFQAMDDDGTPVRPMYQGQTTYDGYGKKY